jgi:hypothetical protein
MNQTKSKKVVVKGKKKEQPMSSWCTRIVG